MKDTREAYDKWAPTYDSVTNNTRDLEARVKRELLANTRFGKILEIGCGTGKNTAWLEEKTSQLTCVDFSEQMIDIARKNKSGKNIRFIQSDITTPWNFGKHDLITCSLILEHIRDLAFIFQEAAKSLEEDGLLYICELHPYKQLTGSRARFEHEGNLIQLEYFVHHISEYFNSALQHNLECIQLNEWFDDNQTELPRLISFVFKIKQAQN
jgi:ubiquinone/menaquinone biosynthesis C-methylase UbiE